MVTDLTSSGAMKKNEYKYVFKNDVLRLANEFYAEHGKWPNELHLGCEWWDGYEEIVDKNILYQKGNPFEIIKHWWYMGMRVFYEHWTHAVEWTKETEEIKLNLSQ